MNDITTRADVLSWRPCYGKTGTLRIMEGLPAEMAALDVLRHEAAKPEDRLWCVLRTGVLSDRVLRLFAAWCARTALEAERAAGREPDVRSWHAVDVAERYALGQATEDEMCDARAAAYDAYATCASYTRAARAAYDAAYAAARAAASEAAYAVARAADDDARAAAACAAARAAQVARLIQTIEEHER